MNLRKEAIAQTFLYPPLVTLVWLVNERLQRQPSQYCLLPKGDGTEYSNTFRIQAPNISNGKK
jgi:hypothetical protein